MWKQQLKAWLTFDNAVQLIAATTGMLGAILIANKEPTGYFAWLVSNAAFLVWSSRAKMWPMLAMTIFYTGTTLQGIRVWMF